MNSPTITNKILYWYDNNKRSLPWRKKNSQIKREYYTLVSEFMLQQTQVSTVIPYFKNFIKNIPNLKMLAKVQNKKLIKLWEGLGYYSRARNLKKTSQVIIKNFKGKVPENFEDLKSLPGIGNYTASAILAIAFNKPYIPLDGNIERVLKRYLYLKKKNEIKKENLKEKKNVFGTTKRSGDYAQALMELGSLICKPHNPLCYQCPISKKCKSFKKKDFNLTKKVKKNITNGIAFVNATFNNTIVSIADDSGNVIAWSSAGSKGFKGSRKSTPYAAQIAADAAATKAQEHGLKILTVKLNFFAIINNINYIEIKFYMKVFIIWLVGVILWNFGYPAASPLEDVIAAIILTFISTYLKKFIKN